MPIVIKPNRNYYCNPLSFVSHDEHLQSIKLREKSLRKCVYWEMFGHITILSSVNMSLDLQNQTDAHRLWPILILPGIWIQIPRWALGRSQLQGRREALTCTDGDSQYSKRSELMSASLQWTEPETAAQATNVWNIKVGLRQCFIKCTTVILWSVQYLLRQCLTTEKHKVHKVSVCVTDKIRGVGLSFIHITLLMGEWQDSIFNSVPLFVGS